MRRLKRLSYLSSLGLLGVTCLSYAGWPTFPVLSAEQVLSVIHTEDCPAGEGKILNGTQFEIFNRYIPKHEHWYWIYEGDGMCHKLAEKLSYINYELYNAVFSGGKITTSYGTNDEILFKFIFKVPPGNCPDNSCPWNCGPLGTQRPALSVGCAQDEK